MRLNEHETHLRAWGHEIWIVNGDYCGKRLLFEAEAEEFSTTLHYHEIKHETMLCVSGAFRIEFDGHDSVNLRLGDSVVIPPGVAHRIVCLSGDGEIIEFSTRHEDTDSIRIGPRAVRA